MFEDENVVVIGGSSGIGLATAKRAAENGASVVIASRSKETRVEAVEQIDGDVTDYELDITDYDELGTFFESVGPIDHLVVTASYVPIGRISELEAGEFEKAFDTKFWGQYHAALSAEPHIREGGSIVLTSGIAAKRPNPRVIAIGVVNGAVETLVKYLTLEFSPIRVNAVSPGTVDTWGMPEADKKELEASLPARHVGEAEDIADGMVFLMKNEFASGTILDIDGGAQYIGP